MMPDEEDITKSEDPDYIPDGEEEFPEMEEEDDDE